jgi:hypothetical protein
MYSLPVLSNFDYSFPYRSSSFPKDLKKNPLRARAAVRPIAVRACINGILNVAAIAIEITTATATRGNQMRINLENLVFILPFTSSLLHTRVLQ